MTKVYSSMQARLEQYSIPEPNTGCWLWMGAASSDGYGNMRVAHRSLGSHRVSWETYIGPIPAGMKVLHKCDTPACINPDHLFLGTDDDNNRDMVIKGRKIQLKGEDLPQSKITAQQVIEIRMSKESHSVIAERYGLSPSNVSGIRLRKTWKHI